MTNTWLEREFAFLAEAIGLSHAFIAFGAHIHLSCDKTLGETKPPMEGATQSTYL